MSEGLLPLFPLKLVLFPAMPLALHIFEERYKEMIGECIGSHTEFGVILNTEQGLAAAGCTAKITSLVNRYEDGRMDILVAGRRRFEVVALNQERSFLRCEALFFTDDELAVPPTAAQGREFLDLCRAILPFLPESVQEAGMELPREYEPDLSFRFLGLLPLDLEFRQQILETRSDAERIEAAMEPLNELRNRLKKIAAVRAKAGTNGSGRH